MNVENYAKELELTVLADAGMEAEITDAYIGDLLSVVMGNCPMKSVWMTVQTHPNILRVASLSDASCIVIAGGAEVEQSLIDKAADEGIALLHTDMSVYELAWRTHEVIK